MKAKLFSAVLALCLLVGTLAGCGNKVTTIATVNGTEVPIGYYTAQQMVMRVQLENRLGDGYEEYMAAANDNDPNKTNADVCNENYRRAFEMLWLYKLKVAEFGIEMDEIRLEYFNKEYEYFKYMFNSTADYRLYLKAANLTEEEHRQIYMESVYYPDLLYAYYFDPDVGQERIDDTQLRNYFDSLVDYSIKHILFAFGEDKAAAKAEAETVLDKINRGILSFDDAMSQYSDDSELGNYPYGYGFVENEEGFPAVFTTAAKELPEEEYGLYESDLGYHIIKRISNDGYFEKVKDIYRQAYGNEQMQLKYNEWLKDLDFQYNQEALTAFDFTAKGRTNVNLRRQSQ